MAKLDDQQIKRVMSQSGIPAQYQNRSLSLGATDKGKEISEWLNEVGRKKLKWGTAVAEVVTESPEGEDLYWLLLRALLLKSVSVVSFHAQELCAPLLDDDVWEKLDDVKVIGVEGLATGIEGQFNESQRGTLEWFLSSRLNAGYSLVMLNDRSLNNAPEFSKRFRQRIHRATLNQFVK